MTLLETERLILRELTFDDAPFILTLLNDPSFLRYINDKNVRNLEDARQYMLNGPMASYARNGFGLYLVEL
jgi:ribosomal-protein-alanine N-acetyltransferase